MSSISETNGFEWPGNPYDPAAWGSDSTLLIKSSANLEPALVIPVTLAEEEDTNKSPEYQAYKVWARENLTDMSPSTGWRLLSEADRDMWKRVAKAAHEHAMLTPNPQSVDCLVVSTSVVTDPATDSALVNLQLRVPKVTPFSNAPLNMPKLTGIVEQASKSMLRISPITSEQIQSEFERLQPDGTIRELQPDEGTW